MKILSFLSCLILSISLPYSLLSLTFNFKEESRNNHLQQVTPYPLYPSTFIKQAEQETEVTYVAPRSSHASSLFSLRTAAQEGGRIFMNVMVYALFPCCWFRSACSSQETNDKVED